jgi:molybdopterin-binding protein
MPASTPTALSATGISKSYDGVVAVDSADIEIQVGRITAILGPSGAGKSTLLRVLGLLEPPDAGQMTIGGALADGTTTPSQAGVTVVFQEPTMFAGSVEYNVGYGLSVRATAKSERAAAIDEVLGNVGLSDLKDASATKLSGGEMRRVALARALVTRPRLLLLDEPLGSLDEPLRRRLGDEFSHALRNAGCGVAWVTHDQTEAAEIADDVCVMRDGRTVAHGSAADVIERPLDAWASEFVGLAPPLGGTVVRETEGVLTVECCGTQILCMGEEPAGSEVLVRIPPDDVVLVAEGERRAMSSARNAIHARVSGLRRSGAALVVMLDVDGGQLAASVLPTSARELGLAPGSPIVAVFKATAAHASGVQGGVSR